jgi:hypothetical protein
MTKLSVTFFVNTLGAYRDFGSQARSNSIAGYLTLETAGYRRLVATDEEGNTLNSINLSMVFPRGETTREALEAMVAEFPNELFVGITPEA